MKIQTDHTCMHACNHTLHIPLLHMTTPVFSKFPHSLDIRISVFPLSFKNTQKQKIQKKIENEKSRRKLGRLLGQELKKESTEYLLQMPEFGVG